MEEKIWIKKGSARWNLDEILLVLTIGTTGQHTLYGEIFVMISSNPETYIATRTTVKKKEMISEYVGEIFNEETLLSEAVTKIRGYYYELNEKNSISEFLPKIKIVDGDKSDILRFWVRDVFSKPIQQIKNDTLNDTLRSQLNEITQLQQLEFS